jgi:hypothetical protein
MASPQMSRKPPEVPDLGPVLSGSRGLPAARSMLMSIGLHSGAVLLTLLNMAAWVPGVPVVRNIVQVFVPGKPKQEPKKNEEKQEENKVTFRLGPTDPPKPEPEPETPAAEDEYERLPDGLSVNWRTSQEGASELGRMMAVQAGQVGFACPDSPLYLCQILDMRTGVLSTVERVQRDLYYWFRFKRTDKFEFVRAAIGRCQPCQGVTAYALFPANYEGKLVSELRKHNMLSPGVHVVIAPNAKMPGGVQVVGTVQIREEETN